MFPFIVRGDLPGLMLQTNTEKGLQNIWQNGNNTLIPLKSMNLYFVKFMAYPVEGLPQWISQSAAIKSEASVFTTPLVHPVGPTVQMVGGLMHVLVAHLAHARAGKALVKETHWWSAYGEILLTSPGPFGYPPPPPQHAVCTLSFIQHAMG